MSASPEKMIDGYNKGIVTGHEVAAWLIEHAADLKLSSIVKAIPESILDTIKKQVENLPIDNIEWDLFVVRIFEFGSDTRTVDVRRFRAGVESFRAYFQSLDRFPEV